MLADADEVDADLVGEDRLFDEVADDLRRVQGFAVRAVGDVAEGVEAEFELNSSASFYCGAGIPPSSACSAQDSMT